MSYVTGTVFWCQFSDSALLDEVTGVSGTESYGSSELVTGVYGTGLQMGTGKSVTWPSFSLSSALSIGFWLKSVNPGMVKNPNTGSTEPLMIPVVSKANFSTSGSGTTTVSGGPFYIYEETQSDGSNKLVVVLRGATTATIKTAAYDTGEFHHFFVVYDGTAQTVAVYKGVSAMSTAVTGTIPSSLNGTPSLLGINKGVPSETYNTVKNTGVLDELVVLNTSSVTTADIQRLVNMGPRYFLDTDYTEIEEVHQAALFDDKTTIRISAVHSDNNRVYVARSDGKLLKDHRDVWQTKRDFSAPDEANGILNSTGSEGYTLSGGILRVTGATIKV